jgi:methylamine dehydrogenase accessory protein MauD
MLHIRVGNASARMTNIGPEIGTKAPEVNASAIGGELITIGGAKTHYTLLLFLTPGCFSCDEMAPAFRGIARHERRQVDLVLIGRGDEADNIRYVGRHRLTEIQMIVSAEIHNLYGITGTPHAVLLEPNGAVLSKGMVNTAVHLESILNTIDVPPASSGHGDVPSGGTASVVVN